MAMDGNTKYEKLLEPGYIGSLKTRNRIIKTGAGMLMMHEDDLVVKEEVTAFYESIAKGGVGLLIFEAPTVDYPMGARWRNRYRIDDDKYIKGLSDLVEVIHKQDCPIFMQMNHDGPWQAKIGFETNPLFTGPPIGASPVSIKTENDFHNDVPREATLEDIERITDKFASAAVRAHKAGFDGVDINAASTHLFHSFLSPFWNKRQDNYGGSLENRSRFLVQTIKEIKKRLGQDFPVSVIINGIEIGRYIGVPDDRCLTVQDSQGIAKLLQEAGADAIQVRSHWMGYHVGAYLPDALFYPEPPVPLKDFPKGYDWRGHGVGANLLLAEGIKKMVSIPVIAVGRLDPDLGEKSIREGKADFIGMTRRLIADPELPNKVASGRIEDIAPCTACLNCLGSGRCRINPFLGTKQNTYEKAERIKKVIVAGSGPAGLEAAMVAAIRGHDVTIYEKSNQLGGLLPVAAMVKGEVFEDLPAIVKYFKVQLEKLGVAIKLGKEINLSEIEKEKPDVVIIATGGKPTVPEIVGADKPIVLSAPKLHNMLKFYMKFFSPGMIRFLSKLWLPIGKRAVIIGGGIQGCEIAEFLVRRGRKVTIVDAADNLGAGMTDALLGHLLMWFDKKSVRMISGAKDLEITDKGLNVTTNKGEKQTIDADSVILATPLIPDKELLKKIEGKVPEIYAIGDCNDPLLIVDAIGAGSRVARAL
jgi:2,4-dienoyl-CoA reductase (NADPH2)